ncbi:hypothetical protein D3C87_1839580 [compost metagenome]
MGEVDDPHHAEDEREPHCDERVDGGVRQAADDGLQEDTKGHVGPVGAERRGPAGGDGAAGVTSRT